MSSTNLQRIVLLLGR